MSLSNMIPMLGSLDFQVALHDGYVNLNSSAAIVSQNVKGVTCAKTGTGEYTFTIANPGYAVKCAFAQVVASTAVDLVAQVKSISNSVVVINLNAGATPTNPSAACGISFLAVSTGSNH